MSKKKNENSFEESLSRLDEISRRLDSEAIGLDEAVSLYEEGIKLSKQCYQQLKEAELKITTLRKTLESEIQEDNGSEV
ncbi:MAG: exodeoxyribonuclease VII small subunit [Ignavibacteria bacterium]